MKNESFVLYKKLCQSMGEDEVHKILSQEKCDIEPNFLGFVDIYKHLSYIIPKHFTIVDLGCAYAAQGYYFRNHKIYHGVDSEPRQRFQFKNAFFHETTIQKFCSYYTQGNEDLLDRVFAICSYVPDDVAKYHVYRTFKNLFVYYPSQAFQDVFKDAYEKEIKVYEPNIFTGKAM